MAVRDRLHRSELAVPGTNARAMEKAPTLGADVVFLDLEDAVALPGRDRSPRRRRRVARACPDRWTLASRPGST
jgi:citrate lyase beta subunit